MGTTLHVVRGGAIVPEVATAIPKVRRHLRIVLSLAHRCPRIFTHPLLGGCERHLCEEALCRSSAVARVADQRRVLCQPVQAECIGIRSACQRPTADAIALLMPLLPSLEQRAAVLEYLLFDRASNFMRLAASNQASAARHHIFRGAGGVVGLELDVVREDAEAVLG